ncbi:trypsin-like serine protease [Paracoccus aestuariivivens]|uniref:Trypsin-like serine protease n=1 Tax=Paracoccus aestuariivivens TaxID=1820333 RepID=A0A6L6JI06_9RHOB|nr:trypsin-like serine protease [Paracoccus aestuariivivens]MTH80197.1 trypsin-like serine protease [Paracoccus aestuariivivens]
MIPPFRQLLFTLLTSVYLSEPAKAEPPLITAEDLRKIAPFAKESYIHDIIDSRENLEAHGINTRLRMAHFLAQVMTETGGLKSLEQSGLDIAADPDLARDSDVALAAALAFWSRNAINKAADSHDRLKVRVLVNGPAANGFAQSKAWFNKIWNEALRDRELLGFEANGDLVPTLGSQDVASFDEILEETGFLDPASLALENAGNARRESILAFQRENGLRETGELDLATEDALLDPLQWRHRQAGPDDTALLNLLHRDATVRIDLKTGAVIVRSASGFEASSGRVTATAGGPSTAPSATSTEPSEQLAALLAMATPIYPEYAPVGDFNENPPSGVVQYGVIGDDDRFAATLEFDPLSHPFSSTVYILFKNKYGEEKSCTGAMVAPKAVLTAAHCIHSGTVKGAPYSDFVVVPGWVGGSINFGDCKALSAQVMGGWLAATSHTELHESDLGLIKLDCEIGKETGWFAMRALGEEEVGLEITVQGYASDRDPRAMQWLSKDWIREMQARKGFHRADTYGGTSGAPIYVSADNKTLVGIHTNTYFGLEEPWKSNNGFSPLTPERLAIISDWIDK